MKALGRLQRACSCVRVIALRDWGWGLGGGIVYYYIFKNIIYALRDAFIEQLHVVELEKLTGAK